MAEIKWIKIYTDIFNNKKIKQIEVLPEGDTIIVIWYKLLCLAGDTNDNGSIYFTKEIPYTDEMLATAFNRSLQVIKMALGVFERFGMIEIIDNIIYVSNWKKYQEDEKNDINKLREQTRKRVEKCRNNKKTLSNEYVYDQKKEEKKDVTLCNVTVTLPVTLQDENVTLQDENKEKSNTKEKLYNIYNIYNSSLKNNKENKENVIINNNMKEREKKSEDFTENLLDLSQDKEESNEESNEENIEKSENNIYEKIFNTFLEQKIIKHNKITLDIKQAINKALSKYTDEEIINAIKRYGEMFNDEKYDYCKYKWSLDKFLTQKNALRDFMNEGSKWNSYLEWKNKNEKNSNKDLHNIFNNDII